MDFLLIVSLIGLVVLGTILNNKFPKIPTALFQVLLGALFAIASFTPNFQFDTGVFMTFIIAPLLFSDGFKLSRSKFWLYKTPIFLMAILLVLVTVIFVGLVIKLLLPAIPLSAAFALAAILSPTDAIAVKSITKGMKLPKGLMDILEGESLLNDAAGLVSFQIALAAVLTGTFSFSQASKDFVVVAIGGALVGAILGLILLKAKSIFIRLVGNESSAIVIFVFLTPIVVYIISGDILGVSGIVAVIATSILFNLERDVFQQNNINSESSLLIESNETTIGYTLNGFVFVFLGYLLPSIFINMYEYKELTIKLALFYVVIITLAMMLTRYLFVYFFYKKFQGHTFVSFQKMARALYERKLDTGDYSRKQYAVIASLSGIHGTITLATAILIPIFLPNGEVFPLRNTILFIASCVVILSMIIGAIFLPLCVKSPKVEYPEANKIRSKVVLETIKEIVANHKPYIPTLKNDNAEDIMRKKQLAYAMVVKKLQEQEIYYKEEKERNLILKDIKNIFKALQIVENNYINALKTDDNINEFVIKILQIRKLRRDKLITYSLISHIILQTKLANIESYYKKIITKAFIKNKKILLKNNNSKEIDEEKSRKMRSEVSQKLFNNFLPTVEKFTQTSYDFLEESKDKYHPTALEFVKTTVHNFADVLFVRFVNDPMSYKYEYDELNMEVIQLQKYRIMTMKKLRHINKSDADTILRDLNYSESLLFVNNE